MVNKLYKYKHFVLKPRVRNFGTIPTDRIRNSELSECMLQIKNRLPDLTESTLQTKNLVSAFPEIAPQIKNRLPEISGADLQRKLLLSDSLCPVFIKIFLPSVLFNCYVNLKKELSDPRHTKYIAYRCFLPNLAGFTRFNCAGPNSIMAEGKGFEPLIQLPIYTLSRRAPSTNSDIPPDIQEGKY